MKKKTMGKLYAPIMCMLLLLVLVIVEQAGFMTETRAPVLEYLETATVAVEMEDRPELLLVYRSDEEQETAFVQQNRDVLEALSIPYALCDLAKAELGELSGYKTLLLATQQIDSLKDDVERLCGWTEEGGHLGLMISPQSDSIFMLLSRKLGIIEFNGEYEKYDSMRFLTNVMPLYENGGVYTDHALDDYLMKVRLSADCTVHIETGDDRHLPILWERPLGEGRVAVFNASLLSEKANRGLTLCTLLALEDTVVYPIVNAGMIYIDDFPAPQPEGTDERLQKDFGYDTQGFFRNHWWPDMKELVYTYGVRYTGVLVETYNRVVEPPFAPDNDERALLKYYASEMMHAGGEIGLHGYNHMPLCPDGFVYSGDDYETWPSTENMALAIKELVRYGSKILPEASFKTYVPPSNYLSEEGQAVLLETVPQVRTISGLYLPETGVDALVQEFREESDGSISVPRITSGFAMDDYNQLVAAQELLLHGVFSHFIHPDDVLDEERGALLGWTALYEAFDDYLKQMKENYPDLRYSTASEGAAAVQRYDRLSVSRTWENDKTLKLKLNGFVDEAWIALRTRETDFTVTGGTVCPINGNMVWIHAESPELTVVWGS